MNRTVVLIDDDTDDIELMQEAIASIDPQAVCIPFTHPVKAIKALVDTRFTFAPKHIFLDHNMPEMMGLDCLRVLRSMKELDATVISVISTSMDQMDAQAFISLGANFAFRKPISISEYGKLLRVVFDQEQA